MTDVMVAPVQEVKEVSFTNYLVSDLQDLGFNVRTYKKGSKFYFEVNGQIVASNNTKSDLHSEILKAVFSTSTSNLYNRVNSLLTEARNDYEKFEIDNNMTAGTRVRKNLMELKNIAHVMRQEIQQIKNKI